MINMSINVKLDILVREQSFLTTIQRNMNWSIITTKYFEIVNYVTPNTKNVLIPL